MEYCTRCKRDTEHSFRTEDDRKFKKTTGNYDTVCDKCGNMKMHIQGFDADLM